MTKERTLSIIKPDAVDKGLIGEVIRRFERGGLLPVAVKMMHLDNKTAGAFYAVHRERPFYDELVEFMTSGPVLVQVLEGEDAVSRNRELMGATDPRAAAAGTLRADFADSVCRNIVHGSDAPETAAEEIAFFFGDDEIFPRP